MSKANDRQVGGDHYRQRPGEQHWDRVDRLGLDYFQAQITKYVERCWLKNGIQDLKKARHFLDKYIELKEAEDKAEVVDLAATNAGKNDEPDNDDVKTIGNGPKRGCNEGGIPSHPSHVWRVDSQSAFCERCKARRGQLSGSLECGSGLKEIVEAEERLAKVLREI